MAHDFVDERTRRRGRKRVRRKRRKRSKRKSIRVEKSGGRGWGWEGWRRRRMKILYPRVRNCDALPRAISAGISIRVRSVNTANRERCIIICRESLSTPQTIVRLRRRLPFLCDVNYATSVPMTRLLYHWHESIN